MQIGIEIQGHVREDSTDTWGAVSPASGKSEALCLLLEILLWWQDSQTTQ